MEVAPKEIRALLGSTQQWMIGVGINVAVSITSPSRRGYILISDNASSNGLVMVALFTRDLSHGASRWPSKSVRRSSCCSGFLSFLNLPAGLLRTAKMMQPVPFSPVCILRKMDRIRTSSNKNISRLASPLQRTDVLLSIPGPSSFLRDLPGAIVSYLRAVSRPSASAQVLMSSCTTAHGYMRPLASRSRCRSWSLACGVHSQFFGTRYLWCLSTVLGGASYWSLQCWGWVLCCVLRLHSRTTSTQPRHTTGPRSVLPSACSSFSHCSSPA